MIKDQIYELTIDDENLDGVMAISLVEEPAIEMNWVYFGKEVKFAAVDNEKRMLMGPILVPDKKILRVDGEGKPYHVFFKPETIKRLSEMYLEKKYTDKATLEHENKIDGVHLVESWIVESRTQDKSSLYGLSLPVGSWAGTFKITNDDIWNEFVKTGAVKGFSIEGMFSHKLVEASRIEELMERELTELSDEEIEVVLGRMKALIKKDSRYKKGQRVEMESYSDYGSGVKGNAKRGRELNEKNGNKCATQVGKVRSAQLEAGEPISLETLKRMYSFLSRAETYYDETDMNACGTISFLLWGGKAGLSYSRNKLKELGQIQAEAQPSVASTYPGEASKKVISPSTIPDKTLGLPKKIKDSVK